MAHIEIRQYEILPEEIDWVKRMVSSFLTISDNNLQLEILYHT